MQAITRARDDAVHERVAVGLRELPELELHALGALGRRPHERHDQHVAAIGRQRLQVSDDELLVLGALAIGA